MKKLFLVLTLAALTLPQAGQAVTWAHTYGTDAYERGFCVQITDDSNYIITGNPWSLLKVDTLGDTLWSRRYEGISGKWVEQTLDGGYVVTTRVPSIMRTDSNGDSLWTKDLGIYSYCAQPTLDGGYVVVGGDNGYEADTSLALIKTDSEGNIVWSRFYQESGNNWNVGYFIQQTDDRGFIIAGRTGFVDTEYHFWLKHWLVKSDSVGNIIWGKTYGEQEWECPKKGHCVRQTKDGGYIITGLTSGGLLLLKTDAQGDSLWAKVYGITDQGTGFNVEQTNDDGYIIVGVTESFAATVSPGITKLWLLKTDAKGDTLWTRLYYGDGYDVGRCVHQTADTGYIVVGYTSSFGAGSTDLYLLKTDSLGLLAVSEEPTLTQENWRIISSVGSNIVLCYTECPQGFRADVFDITGRKVDEIRNSGSSGILSWGETFLPGVYFIRVNNNKHQVSTAKVVLVR